MRLIDAEEAIKNTLTGNSDPIIYRQYAVKVLRDAPTVEKWIPVTERLPECRLIRDIFNRPQCYMSDSVLVCVKSEECDGTHYFVNTDVMSGHTLEKVDWLMTCGYGGSAVYHQEITHWMPLPELPKGE